jgi:hypothetical protein
MWTEQSRSSAAQADGMGRGWIESNPVEECACVGDWRTGKGPRETVPPPAWQSWPRSDRSREECEKENKTNFATSGWSGETGAGKE